MLFRQLYSVDLCWNYVAGATKLIVSHLNLFWFPLSYYIPHYSYCIFYKCSDDSDNSDDETVNTWDTYGTFPISFQLVDVALLATGKCSFPFFLV